MVAFLDHIHVNGLTVDTDDIEKNLIEIADNRWIVGVYGFQDCRFERCQFKQIGIAGNKARLDMVRAAFTRNPLP